MFWVVPIHSDEYMIKLWRCLDLIDGFKNLIGVGYSE